LLPRVPTDLVGRQKLLARLDRGLQRKLTVLAAPAGYGKTTLLADWLCVAPRPAAYLALDEYDADPTSFVAAVVAALAPQSAEFGRDTLALLRLPQLPPAAFLGASLAADVAALPHDAILALDDYHTLNSAAVDELMAALLHRLPPQLHLVIATRGEPALPLARLRARAELIELSAADLRFDREDARALLERASAQTLAEDTVDALLDRTEGWAAGLRLAALALEAPAGTTDPTAARTAAGRGYVDAFMIDEVFAAQEPAVQQFLLATAILDRLCAPLCEAVVDSPAPAARERLALLARRNLFLAPLGAEAGWHRYHGLFREALLQRLQADYAPDAIAALHQRASAWYAAEGWVGEAVRHAVAAGDDAAAAALVERESAAVLAREDWPQLEAWLGLLPLALVRRRPTLVLADACVQYLRFQPAAVPPLLDHAAELLDRPVPEIPAGTADALHGSLDALRGALLLMQDRPAEGLDVAWRAWDRLPPTHAYELGVAAFAVANASAVLDQSEAALAAFEDRMAATAESAPYAAARIGGCRSFVYYARGDLSRLKEVAEQTRREAMTLGLELSIAWADYLRGRVHYAWNELAEAEAAFAAVHAIRHKCHFALLCRAMHGLALAQQAQGRPDAAVRTAETLSAWVAQLPDSRQLSVERSFAARLALLRGDLPSVEGWLERDDPLPPSALLVLDPETPWATRVQALLARGTGAATDRAMQQLADVETATRHLDAFRRLELLTLRALCYQAQGNSAAALDALEPALRLGEPMGAVRVFLDAGPAVGSLLARYAARRGTSPFLARLLAACGAASERHAPGAAPSASTELALVEPLTRRENEVLRLLAARLTNDEIARTLQIAPATVRKHTMNIYQKLQVSGRRHAVAQAIALGVLPSAPPRPSASPVSLSGDIAQR
jgi:LuxR family maltose regulon positive regulatory protein